MSDKPVRHLYGNAPPHPNAACGAPDAAVENTELWTKDVTCEARKGTALWEMALAIETVYSLRRIRRR